MSGVSHLPLRTLSNRVVGFDTLPDSALVSIKEIIALSRRSKTSIWRDVKAKRLAAPIKLGPRCTRFRVADVRTYLAGEAK